MDQNVRIDVTKVAGIDPRAIGTKTRIPRQRTNLPGEQSMIEAAIKAYGATHGTGSGVLLDALDFKSKPSLTVTTAQRSRIIGVSGRAQAISAGVRTERLRPLSSVERPVPPPMATTRRPRSRAAFSKDRSSEILLSIERVSIVSPAKTIRLPGKSLPAKPGRQRDPGTRVR